MKTIIIAFLVLCFTATVGNTNEKTNLNETINNWFVNQKQETIEFQKNGNTISSNTVSAGLVFHGKIECFVSSADTSDVKEFEDIVY